MTIETNWIKTDKHVFGTILREHKKDLRVYSSCSAPDGDMRLGYSYPYMMTEYGFKNSNLPLVKIIETKESVQQSEWNSQYFIAVNNSEEN